MGDKQEEGKLLGCCFIPIAYLDVPKFDAIIFRRTTKQIKNPGGLWQKAEELYKYFPNAEKRISDLQYRFWSTGKGKKKL
jgi:hypothetical protein